MFPQLDDDKRPAFQLADRELLCKNQCGFYGTPQCKGLCSQCWRIHQLEHKRQSDYQNNVKVLRQQDNAESPGRKGSDVRFNTLKLLLKRSPSMFSNSTNVTQSENVQSSSSVAIVAPITGIRPPSPDSLKAQEQLSMYLEDAFPSSLSKELEKQCQTFIESLYKKELLPSEELSLLVQAFYQSIKEFVLKNSSILPEIFNLSHFLTEIETFLCIRAYNILFGSRTEEEAEDLSLQTRIRSLNWVTNGFLETSLEESSIKVQECLNEAITEIVDLNSHRPVTHKLDCLVRCSKNIFDALRESCSGAPASADEFLPVLILVILRANPPLIQSNLKFISRFGLPHRHMRGESGYFFTNLSSAIYFIQDMNANSLQITEEEFEGYTNGSRVPPSRNFISTSVLRSFENSLKKLNELVERQNVLIKCADELEAKLNSDFPSCKQRIRAFVEKCDVQQDKTIKLLCQEVQTDD